MIASQETTIVLDDGAATTVERWGDAGPIMLCVHGMVSSRKSWARLAQRYADRYRVVAYDQRGHGDSAAVRGPMSLDRGVRDLENVLATTGADVLLGHSWGGAIAVRAGARVAVGAVVAIDPMIVQATDAWYDEYLAELEKDFAATGSQRDALTRDAYADWHPVDVDGKVHAVHAMIPEPIARLRTDNEGSAWDLRPDIALYEKPLLLVMAERDGINPPEIVDDVVRNHGAPVRIASIAAGHNLHRTAFDEFAAVLDAFLERTQEPRVDRGSEAPT